MKIRSSEQILQYAICDVLLSRLYIQTARPYDFDFSGMQSDARQYSPDCHTKMYELDLKDGYLLQYYLNMGKVTKDISILSKFHTFALQSGFLLNHLT